MIASAFRSEASSFGIPFCLTLRLGKIFMFLTFLLFLFPGEPLLENRFFGVLVLKFVGKRGFGDSLGERDNETVLLGGLKDGRDVVEFTLLGIGGRMAGIGGGGGMLSFVVRLFRLEFGGADVRLVLPGEDLALLMFVVFVGGTLFVLTGAVFIMFTGATLLVLLGVKRSIFFDVTD